MPDADDFERTDSGIGPAWELPEDPFDLRAWASAMREPGRRVIALGYDEATDTFVYYTNSPKMAQEFAELKALLQVDSADSAPEADEES